MTQRVLADLAPIEVDLQGDAVLVLEDDEGVRKMLARIITSLRGEPVVAATIAQAKEAVARRQFACALIDKNLGEGESGLDFLRWIRAQQATCSPVVITAFGNIDSAVEALRLGAADYLLKPFALDVISHRLGMICERRRMILERELLHAQLLQTDRLAALGTLAAGIVHEINNPLTYLVSNLEYLLERLDALGARTTALNEPLLDFKDVISDTQKGAAQMTAVVKHIKTFAHHEEPNRARIDLKVLLEGALKMSSVLIRTRARLKQTFEAAPQVDGFDFQLAQVFINLLVNASQAIAEGAASDNEVHVRLGTHPTGEAVIEVRDTGAGMGPEVLAKLFQPFFTTKPAGVGTGVGLTICRNIVESHGGRIEVESKVGQGSVFRVILPPASAVAAASAVEAVLLPVGRRGAVLIVDDDPSLASSLARCLELEHDVTTELSGRRAFDRIHAGEHFDVILTDLSMPDVTGEQLHALVAAQHPRLAERMLFMTAGGLSPETTGFSASMGARLLEKPLQLSQLREHIRRLLVSAGPQ